MEYMDADDAAEAIFNLDGSELLGRTIQVSLAQPNQINKLSGGGASASSSSFNEPIWKSDEWFQQLVSGTEAGEAAASDEAKAQQELKTRDVKSLQQI